MVAADLPDPDLRDAVLARLRDHEHVLALPCGDRAIRFRPALTVTDDELTRVADALGRAVRDVSPGVSPDASAEQSRDAQRDRMNDELGGQQ
jgi:L-lysine 6-transaminase